MRDRYRAMCVAWRERDPKTHLPTGESQWCALKGPLDPQAQLDATLCGFNIVMRHGHEHRRPTCPDCKRLLKERAVDD